MRLSPVLFVCPTPLQATGVPARLPVARWKTSRTACNAPFRSSPSSRPGATPRRLRVRALLHEQGQSSDESLGHADYSDLSRFAGLGGQSRSSAGPSPGANNSALATLTKATPVAEDASGSRRVAKQHAAVAMRGLSDTAWCTVLGELSRPLVGCGCATAASSTVANAPCMGGVVEACIAFGGLVGLWTAAFAVNGVRSHARSCVKAARDIVEGWDRHFLYGMRRGDGTGISSHDVMDVVTWLGALDELETAGGARALWEMASSSDPAKRRAVAEALGECTGLESNLVLGVVASLTNDSADSVTDAAQEALHKLVDGHPALSPTNAENQETADNDIADAYATLLDKAEAQMNAALASSSLQEKAAVASPQPSRPDPPHVVPTPARESSDVLGRLRDMVGTRVTDAMRVEAPLFDWLDTSRLPVMCAVAALPLAYELFSLGGGTSDATIRFVGLGWLLSVAGLLAYPQSNTIWVKVEEIFIKETHAHVDI